MDSGWCGRVGSHSRWVGGGEKGRLRDVACLWDWRDDIAHFLCLLFSKEFKFLLNFFFFAFA